jgi:hypothetical protein
MRSTGSALFLVWLVVLVALGAPPVHQAFGRRAEEETMASGRWLAVTVLCATAGAIAGTLVGVVVVWLTAVIAMVVSMTLAFGWWAVCVAFMVLGGWVGWRHDGDVRAAFAALRQRGGGEAVGNREAHP